MCRILAIKNFNFKKHQSLIGEFISLAETGKVPPNNHPGHLDGWGVGYYQFGSAMTVKNGSSAMADKGNILGMLSELAASEALIVHLRKSAWPLTSTKRHAHPFEFKNRMFAHNGTILDYQKLALDVPMGFKPAPDALDSEVFFMYMMQFDGLGLELIDAFRKTVDYIKNNNDYTSLTSVVTDGKTLCATREYANFHPDYYTLFRNESEGSHVLCSEKLPAVDSWTELKNGEMICL